MEFFSIARDKGKSDNKYTRKIVEANQGFFSTLLRQINPKILWKSLGFNFLFIRILLFFRIFFFFVLVLLLNLNLNTM